MHTVVGDASHTSRARSRRIEATRPWSDGSCSQRGKWERGKHTPCMLLCVCHPAPCRPCIGPVSFAEFRVQSLYTRAYTQETLDGRPSGVYLFNYFQFSIHKTCQHDQDCPISRRTGCAGISEQESPLRGAWSLAVLKTRPTTFVVVVVMEARTARTLLAELKVLRSPAHASSASRCRSRS